MYFQVKSTRRYGNQAFRKSELKSFVKWLCSNFSDVSVIFLTSLDFWDLVGKTLSSKVKSGDSISLCYLCFFLMICDVLEKQGAKRSSVKKSRGTPVLPSPSVPPCPPYSPSPAPESRGACDLAQKASEGASAPPNAPSTPQSPFPHRLDHPTSELRSPSTPTPNSPVAPVVRP